VLTQVVVIGGGQAGMAAAFYLRRAKIDYVVLEADVNPGGAWQYGWDSLRLFSPAQHSSLPGWPMPPYAEGYPPASHVVDYLTAYEKRYEVPVERPVRVQAVRRQGKRLRVETDSGEWATDCVISATGTWWRPFLPKIPGSFDGQQIHAVEYRNPTQFQGQRVIVVGGGNSGAQIAADLAEHTDLIWATRRPPRYLADEIDGRALFSIASKDAGGIRALGDIVAVPAVRTARDAGLLHHRQMFTRMQGNSVLWPNGSWSDVNALIWCTGFRPELSHLAPLELNTAGGRIATDGTRAIDERRLHLLGYGDWTGRASATLI
jgi:putative flavoprotein involved in K+ transport